MIAAQQGDGENMYCDAAAGRGCLTANLTSPTSSLPGETHFTDLETEAEGD